MTSRLWALKFVSVALSAASALAQQPLPSIPSTGHPDLDQYRASRLAIYTDDFGELKRYRDADAALAPPATKENRVVFLGDSLPTTGSWQILFRASLTSIAASTDRPRRKCWCASARM